MAQFTYREPVTQGIDRLASTIGAMLDARNQRYAMEQQAKRQSLQDEILRSQLNKTIQDQALADERNRARKAISWTKTMGVPDYSQTQWPDLSQGDEGAAIVPKVNATVPRSVQEMIPEVMEYSTKYGEGDPAQELLKLIALGKEKEKQEPRLDFAPFTDANNITWRIGSNPQTGEIVSRQRLGKEKIRDTYADESIRGRLVTTFNQDTNVKKTINQENFAEQVLEAASSDNPVAHASLPTFMARISGEVGALSEADKAPFGGSRALDARIKQTIEELSSGKRTPENLKFIVGLSETIRNVAYRNRVKLARERAKQYANAYSNRGWKPEDIFAVFAPGEMFEEPSKQATGTTAPQQVQSPAVQQLINNAKNGDKQAASYLKSKGIQY